VLAWLPEWFRQGLREFSNPGVVLGLLVFSLVTLVATLIGVPWFFCRIRPDHFTREDRPSLPFVRAGSWLQPIAHVLRNVLGVVLICLGLAMLLLPGQGLLTVLIGLICVDFPGKRRFERWLVSRPAVARGINRLRRRAGQPPLEVPGA
jgi:hypothetical protein